MLSCPVVVIGPACFLQQNSSVLTARQLLLPCDAVIWQLVAPGAWCFGDAEPGRGLAHHCWLPALEPLLHYMALCNSSDCYCDPAHLSCGMWSPAGKESWGTCGLPPLEYWWLFKNELQTSYRKGLEQAEWRLQQNTGGKAQVYSPFFPVPSPQPNEKKKKQKTFIWSTKPRFCTDTLLFSPLRQVGWQLIWLEFVAFFVFYSKSKKKFTNYFPFLNKWAVLRSCRQKLAFLSSLEVKR